ncbi:MAG: putative sugar nucleotidyl transferase [Rhodothermales bacterium]|nr:putative sugar nucleotidyl transferase [Rhodothermales bacterium]
MYLCLFEDAHVRHLYPLALTRAAGDLRVGAHTLFGRLCRHFEADGVVLHTRGLVAGVTRHEHAGALVNELPEETGGVLMLNQRYLPEPGPLLDRLRAAAASGEPACAFRQGDTVVAAWLPSPQPDLLGADAIGGWHFEGVPEERVEGARLVSRLWHLNEGVEEQITRDLEALAQWGQEGATVEEGAHLIYPNRIKLGEGAVVRTGAIISAANGPVALAAGAEVHERAVVRGPCIIGPKAKVLVAGRVEGSAIGPVSKVGGEVHASVVHSYSNKAHDGYLGDSYLGRWCNLGADANTSNLKNDYGEVSLWDAVAEDFVGTGRQFCGLFMADHSKCSINAMFNTGTVVGVSCNLFGAGFPPRYIPSFSWGGADGLVEYRLEKALRVAEAVMARRDLPLTDADREMLTAVFEHSADARAAVAEA